MLLLVAAILRINPSFSFVPVGNVSIGVFESFRNFLLDILNQRFYGHSQGLFSALLLGHKEALSYELKQIFNNTGTRHIVAISGLHIGIVTLGIWGVARNLPLAKGWQVIFIIGILTGFVLLVGAPASAVRAGIMAGIVAISLLLGRGVRIWHSLAAAALFMILLEPAQLGSISFQLSFLAVSGIVLLKPVIDPFLCKVPNIFKLRDLLSVSVSVLIFLWPVLVFYFEKMSLVSPLANLISVPFLPVLIVGGFAVLVFSMISPSLGVIAVYPVQILSEAIIAGLEALAGLPGAFFEFNISLPVLVGYYVVLVLSVIGTEWYAKRFPCSQS